MSHNFLDVQKNNSFSNTWRNIFFIIILLFAIGGSFFAYFSFSPDGFKQKITNEVARTEDGLKVIENTNADNQNIQIGDIISEPPVEQIKELIKIPELVGKLLDPDTLGAKSIIVKDPETGVILFGKKQYEQRAIASITKLMSAVVLSEQNIEWSQTTQVVGDDVIDTHMYAGDTYSFEDLWNSALIGSSNKAILTLVDKSKWSRDAFIQRMNTKAIELGMKDTVFVEPTGLDAENVSTASDLVLLLEEALKHNKIVKTLLTGEYTIYSNERKKQHHMWSTNWLLLNWVPNTFEIYGGKTGYIDVSGYNFVTRIGEKGGRFLDVVVLGADMHEARFTIARDIAQSVFDAYVWADDIKEDIKIQ